MIGDLRFAIRSLFKTPGFVLVSVITLALGIGANTAMFSVVKAVLLSQLPYPQPDRLVQLWESSKSGHLMWVSGPNARDWRSQNHSLEWMAATEHDTVTLTGSPVAVRAKIAPVTSDFFPLLEVKPEIGRTTGPDDHREGATPVVVIGHGLWQRAFGANPKAIGSTVHMNGHTFTVVGVMPGGFDFPEKTEVWMAHEIFPDHSTRSAHNFTVYGRLKPNVSLQAAQADMNTVASRLANEYVDDKDRGVRVVSLYDQIVGPVRPALLILLAAVGFVLLIACVNVANLQLARGSTRLREMALRAALGAGRTRLVRQLLTESLVIAIVGGLAGVLLAVWATEILRVSIPADIPRIGNVQVDATVLAFTLGLTLLAGVLFGVLPALTAAQVDVNEALKESSVKTSLSAGNRRAGSALVVAEIAIAMVLLVGAGLLIQTFRNVEHVMPGFSTTGILTAELAWPLGPSEADQVRAGVLNKAMLERIRAIRGVVASGVISSFPIKESGSDGNFEIAGRPNSADPHKQPDAYYRLATKGYFEAMEIPLQRGRLFNALDEKPNGSQAALVNEAFVKEFFPREDAIGQRIRFFGFDDKPQFMQIVGVVADVHSLELTKPAVAEVFASGLQHPGDLSSPTIVVRGRTNLMNSVLSAIHSVDPNVPVEFGAVTGILAESISRQRFQMTLLAIFAALALSLSAVGIYGVQSYTMSRRTNELGIRLAVGASPVQLMFLVLKEGLILAMLGVSFGCGGGLLLSRMLGSLVFGIEVTDPITFVSTGAILAAVAMGACLVPARRAARVDPLVALRYE